MEAYEGNESHPYGVVPSGNMYFATHSEVMTRYYGFGPRMCKLTDELIGELLGFLSGTELINMLKVSRTLYCHANSSDLWRDVTLREFEGKGIKYKNNWKDAYMYTRVFHTGSKARIADHVPIRMKGVFSNFLYRSWSCHTCDLTTACPGFYDQSDIPVISAENLTVEAFVEEFEIPNKPVVIRNAMLTSNDNELDRTSFCPALEKWTNEYIAEQCGKDNRLRATSAAAPLPAHFTASEYFAYATQAKEEAPLYLFERNFAKIAPGLLGDYEVSKYFRASTQASSTNNATEDDYSSPIDVSGVNEMGESKAQAQSPTQSQIQSLSKEGVGVVNSNDRIPLNPSKLSDPSLVYETDLFRVLGETGRPDYRWLVAGPARSGSLFHIDPNQTNAWNLCIRGRKKWIFYPPNVPPPGVECSADGADVVVPISTGEWLLTFWKYHLDARNDMDPARRPLEVILNPGELIFVPHGYWHMVVNLEESVALTHNYVSTSNLSDCLRFLREKVDQVSGVRDRGGEAIQPEQLYTSFIKALGSVLPPAILREYIETSLRPAGSDLSDTAKARLLLQRTAKTLKRKRGPGMLGTLGMSGATTSIEQMDNEASSICDVKSSAGGEVEKKTNWGEEKSVFSFGFML